MARVIGNTPPPQITPGAFAGSLLQGLLGGRQTEINRQQAIASEQGKAKQNQILGLIQQGKVTLGANGDLVPAGNTPSQIKNLAEASKLKEETRLLGVSKFSDAIAKLTTALSAELISKKTADALAISLANQLEVELEKSSISGDFSNVDALLAEAERQTGNDLTNIKSDVAVLEQSKKNLADQGVDTSVNPNDIANNPPLSNKVLAGGLATVAGGALISRGRNKAIKNAGKKGLQSTFKALAKIGTSSIGKQSAKKGALGLIAKGLAGAGGVLASPAIGTAVGLGLTGTTIGSAISPLLPQGFAAGFPGADTFRDIASGAINTGRALTGQISPEVQAQLFSNQVTPIQNQRGQFQQQFNGRLF